MNDKIRLNKISVVESSFSTKITSKETDYFINATGQNKQIKINIEETYQLCIPPDYDCNYFLAKGILPSEIEKCQIGEISSLGQLDQNSKFICQFEGKVSYQIKNGKIARLPLSGYVNKLNVINSINYYWISMAWGFPSLYPSSVSYYFPDAISILNNLQGSRPEVRIYPIQTFPDIYNVSVLGDIINLNSNLANNLNPKLYTIGDDLDLTNFMLFDGNLPITEINWDSSNWNQIVTGFLVTLVNSSNPSESEQLLYYSRASDSEINQTSTDIPIGTQNVRLQINSVSFRLVF